MGSRSSFRARTARPAAESQVRSLNLDYEAGLYPSFTYQSAPRLRISPVGGECALDFCSFSCSCAFIRPPSDERQHGCRGEGQNDTSKSGTGEVAADDRNGLADSARALGLVEAVFAFGEGCVEEGEAWSWGFGDGGVLGAGEEGQRGEGQEFLEIHGR